MARPCVCESARPGPYTPDQCRLCWLFHNHPDYRQLWGGPAPGASARWALPCVYLGTVLDRQGCNCPRLWRRRCELHTTCTLAGCQTCPDYQADE